MGLLGKLFNKDKVGEATQPTGGGGDGWSVGDQYVLAGKGVVTLKSINDGELECEQDEETTFRVSSERANDMLRPVSTKQQAEQLLEHLSQRQPVLDGRPAGKRSVSYRRTLKSLSLEEQVTTLCTMYGHKNPEHAEKQHIPRYEELIFPELGTALGKSRRAIKALVRNAVLGEKPPVSMEAPDRTDELRKHEELSELPPYQAIAAFAVERELGIGEWGQSLTVKAKPGIWYGYQRPYFDEEDGEYDDSDFDRMVAVHHEHVSEFLELEQSATEEGEEMPIEGATMSIMDAGFAADEE